MTVPSRALLVFFRYPELGSVKTRLAAAIGDTEALRLHTLLVRRTLGIVYDFKRSHPEVSVLLLVTPPERDEAISRVFPGPWSVVQQEGVHLGERMGRAIQWAMARGAREVVLLGSDIVDIQAADLEAAFARLREGKVVLGPARDGGFYLLGLRQYAEAPFRPVEWGTERILERTSRLFRSAGFQVETLTSRQDIDRPADLKWVQREALFLSRISVVIPTLRNPSRLHPWLLDLIDRIWPDDEVVVVRGIEPGGLERGRVGGVELDERIRIVNAPRGRGIQLNYGARCARGSVLLFLHDDTRLPDQFPYLVRKAVQNSRTALGSFRLSFSPSTRGLDLVARWANARTRLFRLPYGDQALFCRREVFEKVGGFQRRYLMEDVDLVRACRLEGDLTLLDETVATSPDRYLSRGIIRASLHNHLTLLLHFLGVDEARLYAWYYRRNAHTPRKDVLE
jgi:hypothetical protein